MATVTASTHDAIETSTPIIDEPEKFYEVVDGKVVENAPMGAYEVDIACLLMAVMDEYARANGLGKVFSEMLFRLQAEPRLARRPDVAFVSDARWPFGRRAPRAAAWDVVPDLAVEVVSPTNRTLDDMAKLEDYFRAGVRAVWVICPGLDKVYVYESPTKVSILSRGEALDGGTVLPGFGISLIDLFGEPGE